jgi:hypothetical protein
MMTKKLGNISWIIGLAALTVGCRFAYDNGVEWDTGNNSTHSETETTPSDSPDDSEPLDDSETMGDSETTDTEVSCEDGWQAEGGTCVFSLAKDQAWPGVMAIDDSYVYWATMGSVDSLGNPLNDAAIKRVRKSGGEVEQIANNGNNVVSIIRVDETDVYWVNYLTNNQIDGYELLRAPKDGGEPELLTGSQDMNVLGMELGKTQVLFAVNDFLPDCPSVSTPTYIMMQPKDGSAEPTVFYEEPRAVGAMTVSADKTTLYWTGLTPYDEWESGGTLTRSPIDQLSDPIVRNLSRPQEFPSGRMSVDDDAVYFTEFWAAGSEPQLRKYSLNENDMDGLTVATTPNGQEFYTYHSSFVCDLFGNDIYWAQVYQTEDDPNLKLYMIARSPKEPGDAVTLIDNQPMVSGLAVDEDFVYWMKQGNWVGDGTSPPTGELIKMKRPDASEPIDEDTESESDDSDTSDSGVGCDEGWRQEGDACIFPIAENQKRPTSLAADENYIYWAVWGSRDALNNYLEDGAVYKAPKAGGDVVVLADGLNVAGNIRVDDAHVYWLSGTAPVMRVSKDGGTPEVVLDKSNGIFDIAINDDSIFFAERKSSTEEETGTLIMEMPKDQSREATVFYEESEVIQALSMSPDGRTLYWYAAALMKSPVDKTLEPSIVGNPGGEIGKIAVDEEAAYYVYEGPAGDTALRKLLLADEGGEGITLALAEFTGGNAVPLGEYVYWTRYNDGMITRSPKTPGDSVDLVANQNSPVDIAVDEDAVYWINAGDDLVNPNGGVYKMVRE